MKELLKLGFATQVGNSAAMETSQSRFTQVEQLPYGRESNSPMQKNTPKPKMKAPVRTALKFPTPK